MRDTRTTLNRPVSALTVHRCGHRARSTCYTRAAPYRLVPQRAEWARWISGRTGTGANTAAPAAAAKPTADAAWEDTWKKAGTPYQVSRCDSQSAVAAT